MSIFNLNVSKRLETDPTPKKLRQQNKTPGVFYYRDGKSINIVIDNKEVHALFKSHSKIVRITLENNRKVLAVTKEVQRDPISRRPLHISLEAVKEGMPCHVALPVKLNFNEDSPCHHGVIRRNLDVLEVEVLPENLPDSIEIDISKLEIGQGLHISDLHMPGIKFLDRPQLEVLSIQAPMIFIEEEKKVEGTELVAAEGGAATVSAAEIKRPHQEHA